MSDQFFECQPKLAKQIANKIKEPVTREDLLQEVFIKFATKLETIEHQENLCGYLHRITQNTIIDYYRKESRYLLVDDEQYFDKFDSTPQIESHYKLANCCFRLFINNLPSKYKEALILVELEGRSQREAATALGMSYSGLKSRVQRGREKLKEAILNCCHYEFDKYGNIIGVGSKTN